MHPSPHLSNYPFCPSWLCVLYSYFVCFYRKLIISHPFNAVLVNIPAINKRMQFKLHRNVALHQYSTCPFKTVLERIGCAIGRVCECGGHVHKYTTFPQIKKPPVKTGSRFTLMKPQNLLNCRCHLISHCRPCCCPSFRR